MKLPAEDDIYIYRAGIRDRVIFSIKGADKIIRDVITADDLLKMKKVKLYDKPFPIQMPLTNGNSCINKHLTLVHRHSQVFCFIFCFLLIQQSKPRYNRISLLPYVAIWHSYLRYTDG